MAVASLVLGIISAAICWVPLVGQWIGIPAGIISVILGIVIMRDKTQTPQNRNMAIAGLILGAIGIVVSIIIIIVAMAFLNTAGNILKDVLDEGGGLEKSLEDLGEGLKKGLEDLTKELPTTPPMF